MHMLSADSLPLLLEMPSVLIGARSHSHQNAAVADARFILFGTLFRDAPIAKGVGNYKGTKVHSLSLRT